MKRPFFFGGLAAAAIAACLFSAAPASAAASVGEAAPDFQAVDINGKPVKLSDYRGKLVVLEWTNRDCPFVRKHYESGNMQTLQRSITGQDAVWLTIISSAEGEQGWFTPEAASEHLKKVEAAPSAKILDPSGEIGRAYGAQVTPHMYVIDAEGRLAYAGAIDDKPSTKKDDVPTAKPYFKNAFEAVKAGQTPDPAATRAYGCTIKYAS